MVNSGLAAQQSTKDKHKIKKVQFGILSEQEILSTSVCEIGSTFIYDKDTGLPAEGGLNDLRMGVTSRGLICQTCFSEMKECPGHYGHIKLEEPVYHIGFMNQALKILKCVCYNCSIILLTDAKLKSVMKIKNPKKRLRAIMKMATHECYSAEPGEESTTKMARGCGHKQPKFIKKGGQIIIKKGAISDDDVDSKRPLRASEAYEILSRIDDETVELLGMDAQFARPENLIIKVLIVAPPTVRPSIELSSNAKSEDDLTHMYQSILSTNMELQKAKASGQPVTRLDDIVNRLQSFCGYLMNNEEGKAK